MASFITGALFAFIVIYVKYGNPGFPLTHWFNAMSYYIKIGFVIIIMSAMFLYSPSRSLVLFTMLGSVVITFIFQTALPELNYFVRTAWVIVIGFGIIAVPTIIRNGLRLPEGQFFEVSHRSVLHFGIILALSLIGASYSLPLADRICTQLILLFHHNRENTLRRSVTLSLVTGLIKHKPVLLNINHFKPYGI